MSIETLQKLISPLFNEYVVQEIFEKASNYKQVAIKNIEIENTEETKGYSFLSDVVKFTIEGKEKNNEQTEIKCSVIVKFQPKNIGRRLSFRTSDFYRNEVKFYNEVWNTLLKFQDNIKNKFNNIPICYSARCDGQNDYIALEDLSKQNYVTFKKQKGMDYTSVIFIVKLFARFHALSLAFKDQHPKEFERLADIIEETYIHENFRIWFADHFKQIVNVSRDAIEKELNSYYLEQFDDLINNDLYGRMCKICSNKSNKFSVICQGDAWIPNFLVQYGEDNTIIDIKLIDFQIARCCTPSCDLVFFLYCCVSYDLFNKHWDDILKEYHKEFTRFLSELGSDPNIFTFEDLKQDVQDNALLGFGLSMEGIPNQQMEENEAPNLDIIEGTKAVNIASVWKLHPMKQEGRRVLANIFKHVVDNKFI